MNKLEYNCALYISSISLFLGIGISKIINCVGSDSWLVIIIGSIIGIGLIKVISLFDGNNIFRYFYSFIILTINLLLVTKLISSIYLNKTSDFLVVLPLILLIYYSTNKDINLIFKLSQIMCFVFILFALFPTITLSPNIDIDNFLPLVTSSPLSIIKSSIDYALISTSPYILFPNLKDNMCYKSYILSSITLFIIFVNIIGNLSVNLSKLYRYPEYMIFKEISLLGFIENIQNILSFLWLFSSFILSSFATYNIRKSTSNYGFIFTLILIMILLTKFLLNNYIYTEYITKYYGEILLFSIILFILGYRKKS